MSEAAQDLRQHWQTLSPYLDEALGLAEEERAAWLERQDPNVAALLRTWPHAAQVWVAEIDPETVLGQRLLCEKSRSLESVCQAPEARGKSCDEVTYGARVGRSNSGLKNRLAMAAKMIGVKPTTAA